MPPKISPDEFLKNFTEAISNPQEQQSILDLAKMMTPDLTDEQRADRLKTVLGNLSQLKIKTNGTAEEAAEMKRAQKDYKLAIVNQPIEKLLTDRTTYYEQCYLSPPQDYEPRKDVSKWDQIDVYETVYLMSTLEDPSKKLYHETKWQAYLLWLRS